MNRQIVAVAKLAQLGVTNWDQVIAYASNSEYQPERSSEVVELAEQVWPERLQGSNRFSLKINLDASLRE